MCHLAFSAVLLVLTGPNLAAAQVVQFNSVAVPPKGSLAGYHSFFVFGNADAERPEASNGKTFIKFHGLSLHPSADAATKVDISKYEAVQVGLVKRGLVTSYFTDTEFCCSQHDVDVGLCPMVEKLVVTLPDKKRVLAKAGDSPDILVTTARVGAEARDVSFDIRDTDEYMLVLSNCGNVDNATFSGSVIVKNPYGFLPGIEYKAMQLFNRLWCAHLALALVWVVLSMRWWKKLTAIHHCIGLIIMLGLLEILFCCLFYTHWNTSGLSSRNLWCLSCIFASVQRVAILILALAVSLGWCVTKPFLGTSDVNHMKRLAAVVMITALIAELHQFPNYNPDGTQAALSAASVGLATSASAYCGYLVFEALTGQLEALKSRGQSDKSRFFEQQRCVLLSYVVLSTLIMVLQGVVYMGWLGIPRWNLWVYEQGLPRLLSLVMLVTVVYFWRPQEDSLAYAFTRGYDIQAGKEATKKEEESKGIWAVEGADDNEGFWETTMGGPSDPTTLGAPRRESDDEEKQQLKQDEGAMVL